MENETSKCKNNEIDWIGTWRAAQQLTEPHNNPQEIGLSYNTLGK